MCTQEYAAHSFLGPLSFPRHPLPQYPLLQGMFTPNPDVTGSPDAQHPKPSCVMSRCPPGITASPLY